MPDKPFPPAGPGAEGPPGSAPLPEHGNGPHDHTPEHDLPDAPGAHDAPEASGPEQGLFVCLPTENMELSRFGGDDQTPPMAPGPLLAGVAYAVAGGDGAGLAGVSEDFLFAMIAGGRRMASWGTWLEFSAMRELALRHPAVPARPRKARPGTAQAPDATAAAGDPAIPDQPAIQDQPAASAPASTADAVQAGAAQAGAAQADAVQAGAAQAGAAQAGGAQAGAAQAGPAAAAVSPADDGRVQFAEFVADEVAAGLRMTWLGAADRISYACALAGRLPVTFAAMGAGQIDPVHAKIIYEQTDILSAADAAKADPVLAAVAQHKTYGELRAAAVRLVLKLDPDSAERRKQKRRKEEAHVRPFREDSGNAGMTAREMPSDEVLASWQHIDQRARDLRAAGVPGTLRELRVRAYLDLLQERDSRDALSSGPDSGHEGTGGSPGSPGAPGGPSAPGGPRGPAGPDGGNGGNGGPGGNPAPGTNPARRAGAGTSGPSLASLVNLTVTLGTATGESQTPGEAAGFGLLDAGSARDLIAAAARSPRTRWCVTVLNPDGTAAAHDCATGQHPAPPGPEPPSSTPHPPPGTTGPADTSGAPAQRPPPGARARDYLRSLGVTLTPIARGSCDHRHAETGYQPSRKLRHLVTARSTRCTAPGCGRPAARCDLDHTVAWDAGGITCECDLAPLCRHHHRCKQAHGWRLEQPEPGVLVWHTPGGRTYTTTPTEYEV